MNKRIICILSAFVPSLLFAQKVQIKIGEQFVDIKAQQTQSELKPGWTIMDLKMKDKVCHYIWGKQARQMAEDPNPIFHITVTEEETLQDYAIIKLVRNKQYRKLAKANIRDNEYERIELANFDIKATESGFICKKNKPLATGEYIIVNIAQKTIGELHDYIVYPFQIR